MSLLSTLDAAVAAADHLTAKDAATVEAARLLANKIDAEADLIDAYLAWYRENDITPPGPLKLDNVSVPTFLKYMQSLGLVPDASASSAAPVASPTAKLDELRAKRATKRVSGQD